MTTLSHCLYHSLVALSITLWRINCRCLNTEIVERCCCSYTADDGDELLMIMKKALALVIFVDCNDDIVANADGW